MDYFNSVHPNNFRLKAPEASKPEVTDLQLSPKNLPINKSKNLTINKSNIKAIDDFIYEYLKTFSQYKIKKNGLIVRYNQQISYSFSNIAYNTIKVTKLEGIINNYLNLKTNLINQINTNFPNIAAPLNALTLATENINNNKHIMDLLNKEPIISQYPELLTEEENFPLFSKTNIAADQKTTPPIILSKSPMNLGLAQQPVLMQLSQLTKQKPKIAPDSKTK